MKAIRLIALLPLCIWHAGLSFVFSSNAEDVRNRARFAGWLDDYPEPKQPGSRAHWLKNRLSEWAKADGQRAAKAGSFLIVALAPFALFGLATLGRVLWRLF